MADVIASSFRSAGQRCSALRLLLVQEEVRDGLVKMLIQADRFGTSVGVSWMQSGTNILRRG